MRAVHQDRGEDNLPQVHPHHRDERWVDICVDIYQSIYLFIYLFPRVRREADGGREGVPPRLLLLLLMLGAAGQRVRQPGWSVDIIDIKSISSSASKNCIRIASEGS